MSLLYKATQELLDLKSKEEWHDLAKEVGCTYTWIAQISKGHASSPGVHKLEKLFLVLGGKFSDLDI